MRKFLLAAATLGILSTGGILKAHADSRDPQERADFNFTQQESAATQRGEVLVAPGVSVPAGAAVVAPDPLIEGRNVYIAPDSNYVSSDPALNNEPAYQRDEATSGSNWTMPGDQNMINQEKANERSTK